MADITLAVEEVGGSTQATPIDNDQNRLQITVASGKSVRLTATSSDSGAPISKVTWEHDGNFETAVTLVPSEMSVTREIAVGTDTVGRYLARATVDNQAAEITSTQSVRLALVEPPPAGTSTPPDRVAETDVGFYDPLFAKTAGVYVTVVAVAFCVVVTVALFELFPVGRAGSSLLGDGVLTVLRVQVEQRDELADRVGWILPAGMMVGVLVLAAGAFVGMLEARGRLLGIPANGGGKTDGHRGPLADALTAGAKLLDSAKTLRATVLLVVAGTVITCVAMLSVVWAPSSSGRPNDVQTSTTATGESSLEGSGAGETDPTSASDDEAPPGGAARSGPDDAPTTG